MTDALFTYPLSTDLVTQEEYDVLSNTVLKLDAGGTVSGDVGIFQKNVSILSGNFLQSDSSNVLNYSAKNAFIQAEEAPNYGPAYTGTKGYCILSVLRETSQIMVMGNVSAIANLLDDSKTTIEEKYPYIFPTKSRSIKLFNGKNPTALLTPEDLKDLYYSFALGSKSTSKAFKILNVEQYEPQGDGVLSNGYGILSIDNMPIVLANAMPLTATYEDYYYAFLNDDNCLYCPGLPNIGNVIIENLYGQHAEGGSIRAIGKYSHAEGRDNIADARYTHVEGSHNVAGETASHAEGINNIAIGFYAHAENESNKAIGRSSHASGKYAIAKDDLAYVWNGNANNNNNEFSSNGIGTFNINPLSGINGFYIGTESLSTIIQNSVNNILIEKGLI